MKKRRGIKRMLAAVAAISVLAGTAMTVSAETVVYDDASGRWRCIEDDGSAGVNKWAQNERGYWLYFGPEGVNITGQCDRPYPLGIWWDGSYFFDERTRSATGTEGQQPVFSVPSTKKDLRYKGLRQTLDSIPLYPEVRTPRAELDAHLDAIFAQIITPDMDTHDKLKACYDYLLANMKDGRYEDTGDLAMMMVFWYDEETGEPLPQAYCDAYSLLESRVGVCDTFSATFAVMAWKIGVPMYIVGGETSRASGGYTPHAWCQLDGPDGVSYIFDPQVDYLITLRGNGTLSDNRFGAPLTQVANKYAHVSYIFDI